jgi:hypothetical protein
MLYIPLSRAWVLCKGIAPLPLPGNFSIFEFVHGLLEVIYHRFSHIDTNANPRRSAGTHLVKIYNNALTFSIVIHNAFFFFKKKFWSWIFFLRLYHFMNTCNLFYKGNIKKREPKCRTWKTRMVAFSIM